jgi:hypothetical protein
MKKSKKRCGLLLMAVTIGFLLVQCSEEADGGADGNSDGRAVLTAGVSTITIEADEEATNNTTKVVFFTGAAGLEQLTSADFGVTGGGAVGDVSVDGDRVTLIITFKANPPSAKVYNVVIASTSEIVKGDANVKVIHLGTDGSSRIILTAGGPVEVSAEVQTAEVTFTAGEALTFTPELEDFTVAGGGTVTGVSVDGDTVTVTVGFPKNNIDSPRNYTVSVAEDSEIVRGSGSVTITQLGADLQASTLYVSSDGDDEENDGQPDRPFKTLAHAYTAALTRPAVQTIAVLSDLDLTVDLGWDDDAVVPMELNADGGTPQEITIKSDNGQRTLTRSSGSNDAVVKVTGGAQVVFSNITIDGKNNISKGSVRNRALYIEGPATEVTLATGAYLVGKIMSDGEGSLNGGAVYVKSGTLTMNVNSKIEGEALSDPYEVFYGGGVYLEAAGRFTMNGGTVRGRAPYGGGIFSMGTFTMNNGEISGCTNPLVYVISYGTGVYVGGGTFDMTGGTIKDNILNVDSNGYYGGNGGGVYVRSGGEFTMSGRSVISGNKAERGDYGGVGYGGGVYVESGGTFTMDSGSIIYGSNESGVDDFGKPLKNTATAADDNRGDAYRTNGGQHSNDTITSYSPSP